MKKNLFMSLFLLQNLYAFTQSTPESFLQKLPAPPSTQTICSATTDSKRLYLEKIEAVEALLEVEITRLQENEAQNESTINEQTKKKISADYNLSASDMQKLQNGEMSKEETDAMVDKILQQKYNISLEETNDMAKKSKKAQDAWGESVATEQMAETEANPKKNQDVLKKDMSLAEMSKEKEELYKKLMADEKSIGERFTELDSDQQGKLLLRSIDSLFKKYQKSIGSNNGKEAEMDALRSEIVTKEQAYCKIYSPRYLTVLEQYQTMVKKNIPDYNRLEELTNKINKVQLGTTTDVVIKGSMGLQYIKGYIGKLKDAHKYCIYEGDNEFISPIFKR